MSICAYRDGVASPSRALLFDIGVTVAVGAVIAVSISVATEPGSRPVDAGAYVLGVAMALPLLVRRRWPLAVLLVISVLLFGYYTVYPGFAPSPVLAVPLYTAALAGRLGWAIGVPVFYFSVGYLVVSLKRSDPYITFAGFLPHIALCAVVVLLAEVIRSRRALAEETQERLRQAEQDRERESARRVAEERVRIARELHDTVAHSMATITVQAGSALHVLGDRPDNVRTALTAIRDTSRGALQELRATLGVLRDGAESQSYGSAGLDRLPALVDAVRAAGVPVTLHVTGRVVPLESSADHTAYRILQESLTNVLRHGGTEVRARIRMAYDPMGLAIEVTDDGAGGSGPWGGEGGHGLDGMRERAESVGGTLTAGPRPGGGFVVSARLPGGAR
jgi:signal transduction histidine kinase